MSFFDELKRKAQGVVAQVTPSFIDHGATYSTVTRRVQPSAPKPPSINVQQPRFSQPTYSQPSVQSPNFSTPKMSTTPHMNSGFGHAFSDFAHHQLKDLGTAVGLGAVRSGIGTAQAVSGLYDLATPGTGTNRFSKALDTQAKFVDQTAKPYNQLAYKGGQLAGDALTFGGAGKALKAVSEVPKVAKVIAPVARVGAPIDNGLSKVTTSLANKGFGGRVASAAIHSATRPANIGANLAMTANYTGQQASKGVDINPAEVERNLALGTALSAGLPASGQLLKEGARAIKPTAKATVKTAQAVKYTTDKLDPAVREVDSQYADLNKRWQTASAQQRKNIEKAIQQNRQHRDDITRVGLGNGVRPVNPESLPDNARPTLNQALVGVPANASKLGSTSYGVTDPMDAVFAQNPLASVGDVIRANGGIAQSAAKVTTKAESKTPIRQLSEKIDQTGNRPTYPNDTPLPVEGTRQVGKLDKAFRSTRSIIERQGNEGKQLADMLQGSRDAHELMLADIQKRIPTVRSLKGKAYENFVDATQGLAQPQNDKVAQAVKEWQATHPLIRDRAVAAGLDVGNLGPKYYPHFIDYAQVFKDKNMYNAAINHLVDTGQAQSPEEAIKLLNYAKDVSRNRQFGNLESSRLVDLPFYDKTPNSLISYLNGSAKRIAQTETFGKQDEKALKLIAQAGVKGYDTEAMKNAYDVAVGAKQYNPNAAAVSGNIRKYITTTRLGLGALTNVSQNVNTGIVTGHLRTLGAAIKQLDPKTRSFVSDTGVIADAVLNDLKTQSGYSSFSQKVLGNVVNKITAPGFGAVEKLNRSIAATAGRDYGLRLAQKGDEKTLRRLGVTGEIKNNTLTEAQQIQIARKVVEKTQFKVDPQDLPGWTDSPGGKLVSQFRTFSYNQTKFVNDEILKPAAHGNLLPLGRLLAALPVGYGLYQTKTAISGRPNNDSPTKQGLQAFQNIGGAGLVFDMYQSLNPIGSKYLPSDRRQSMAVGAFGGPAVGLAAQGVGAVSDLIQRKNAPSDPSKLQGKLALGNNGDTYTDATSAARFGLQQIPVVGTAIKNRLLPFQTESNADAGKLPGEGKASAATIVATKPSDQIKAAFTTPEGKAFIKLSDADKKAAAQTDPTMRALYDEYTSMKTALNGGKQLYPAGLNADYAKQQLGLDNFDPVKVLQRFDRLTPKGQDAVMQRENDAEFNYKIANYLKDKADGKLTDIEDLKKQNELARLYVGKDYDKQTRDLQGLSKTLIYKYLTNNKNGEALAEKVLAYDDALTAAGVQSKNKFRDKYGNPDFDPASNGSGKGKGGGRRGTRALPTFSTPKTVKISGAAHFKSHKVSVRAKKVKTSVRTIPRN